MVYELTGATKKIGDITVYQIRYPQTKVHPTRLGGWIDKPEILSQFKHAYIGKNSIVYRSVFKNDFIIDEDCIISYSTFEPKIHI